MKAHNLVIGLAALVALFFLAEIGVGQIGHEGIGPRNGKPATELPKTHGKNSGNMPPNGGGD